MFRTFQDTLRKDAERIRKFANMFVKADKTRNLYEMKPEQHSKLFRDNITKHYKLAPGRAYKDINRGAQKIAKRLKLDDRMEVLAKSEAFITLKDHKDNFADSLPCRLINPAMPEVGVISKKILERIVGDVRKATEVNLWKNTGDVIDWFHGIQDKKKHTFLTFDIVEFYPSISADLLMEAVKFARQYTDITKEEEEVIFQARESLLFENERAWMKREKDTLFDVTMGSFDEAETCELVGVFVHNKLSGFFEKRAVGLYRDDGLDVLRNMSGHSADSARKDIIEMFKTHGLRITIDIHQTTTNFLDVTFNLVTGKHRPYP